MTTSRYLVLILLLLTTVVPVVQLRAENCGASGDSTYVNGPDSLVWAAFSKVDMELRKTYEMWSGIPLELALYLEEGFTRDSAAFLLSQKKSFWPSDPVKVPVNELVGRQGVDIRETDGVVVLSVLMKYSGSLSQLESLGVRLSRHNKRDRGQTFAEFPIELLPRIVRMPVVTVIREVRTLVPLN